MTRCQCSNGYAYGELLDADLLPSRRAIRRIVDVTRASMQTRNIWQEVGREEAGWAVLVEEIQLFWSRVSPSDDSDWSDDSGTEF